MDFFQTLSQWASDNPGKTVGGIAGFVLGVLLFTLGIVKTLLVLALVGAGIFIGKARDNGRSIFDEIKGLFGKD